MIFAYTRVVDANGTLVPDAAGDATFHVTNPARLASPETVPVEAGIATALGEMPAGAKTARLTATTTQGDRTLDASASLLLP